MPTPIEVLLHSQISTLQTLSVMIELLLQTHQDVNGLKASVKGLDPTFSDVFQANRKKADTESLVLPVVAQIQMTIDGLISPLQDMLHSVSES